MRVEVAVARVVLNANALLRKELAPTIDKCVPFAQENARLSCPDLSECQLCTASAILASLFEIIFFQ